MNINRRDKAGDFFFFFNSLLTSLFGEDYFIPLDSPRLMMGIYVAKHCDPKA